MRVILQAKKISKLGFTCELIKGILCPLKTAAFCGGFV